MTAGYRVAVVGDLNLDIVIRLPDGALADRTNDVFVEAPMTIRAAGTGASFALAAASAFEQVHLFGRVGDDDIAEAIVKELKHPAISLHVARDTQKPSRVVLILREGPLGMPGRRVMIPRTDVANSALTEDDLSGLHDGASHADVVLVDGYSYLQEPARTSISRAAARLASDGRRVAFDVVPHNLYSRWSLAELLSVLRPASIVIAEVVTLLRFIGLNDQARTADAVRELVPRLRKVLGPRTLMLRFGVGQIDQSMVVWPDGSTRHRKTGYAVTDDPAGFGDRLTAAELVEVLDRLEGPL